MSAALSSIPPSVAARLRPIDDAGRSGRYQLVTDRTRFACARWCWHAQEWLYPGRKPVGFTPTEYQA